MTAAPVANNVVELRPKQAPAVPLELRIWTCFCGCRLFCLYEGGSIECQDCGTWQSGYWLEDEP